MGGARSAPCGHCPDRISGNGALWAVVGRLKGTGVGEVTVRLAKGFISKEMVEIL